MATLHPKNKQNTYPKFSPSDLKDPTLFKLQSSFDFLYSQIEQIQNAEVTPATSGSSSISGGVSGQVLTSNGAGVATFQALPSADVLSAVPSGALTNGTGFAPVPGLAVTLDRNGLWIITATLDINCDNTSGGATSQLVVNSVAQSGLLRYNSSATSTGITLSRSWIYTNSSGSVIAKIESKCGFALGSSVIAATSSILIAEFKG